MVPLSVINIKQAMGRAGRLMPNGERETSMLTLLYNAQDLAVAGMSSGMKELCRSKSRCLKEILRSTFVGTYSVELTAGSSQSCCTVCDKLMAT